MSPKRADGCYAFISPIFTLRVVVSPFPVNTEIARPTDVAIINNNNTMCPLLEFRLTYKITTAFRPIDGSDWCCSRKTRKTRRERAGARAVLL